MEITEQNSEVKESAEETNTEISEEDSKLQISESTELEEESENKEQCEFWRGKDCSYHKSHFEIANF